LNLIPSHRLDIPGSKNKMIMIKESWNRERQTLIGASNDFATLTMTGVKKTQKIS
jgi:hypothetical protein